MAPFVLPGTMPSSMKSDMTLPGSIAVMQQSVTSLSQSHIIYIRYLELTTMVNHLFERM